MQTTKTINELTKIAKEIRIDVIKMLTEAGSGHPGGSLSEVEILLHLFYNVINRTKENALSPTRDRFVLSKGHGVPTLYAIFAKLGLIEEKELFTLRKIGARLQGHPDRLLLPYCEASTGSLGQGLSIAQGMSLAARINKENWKVYCLIGDGECQEGQIWEAAMSIPHFKIDNLCAILDYNKGQIDGFVKDIMNVEPVVDKFKSFGWHTIEIDGHDFNQIDKAFKEFETVKGKPTMIVAHTIKGKGVSFMENNIDWHGVAPKPEEAERALKELSV